MILVADESVAGPIVERLRADGHTILSIRETTPSIPDDQVLARSIAEAAPLLTEDTDFGELVYRLAAEHAGVILIPSLDALPRATRVELVSRAVRDHGTEFAGRFTVITLKGIRIRTPAADDQSNP